MNNFSLPMNLPMLQLMQFGLQNPGVAAQVAASAGLEPPAPGAPPGAQPGATPDTAAAGEIDPQMLMALGSVMPTEGPPAPSNYAPAPIAPQSPAGANRSTLPQLLALLSGGNAGPGAGGVPALSRLMGGLR